MMIMRVESFSFLVTKNGSKKSLELLLYFHHIKFTKLDQSQRE